MDSTRKWWSRLEVLKLIESKQINQIQGANQLGLSTRQLRRIQLNYRKQPVGITTWM